MTAILIRALTLCHGNSRIKSLPPRPGNTCRTAVCTSMRDVRSHVSGGHSPSRTVTVHYRVVSRLFAERPKPPIPIAQGTIVRVSRGTAKWINFAVLLRKVHVCRLIAVEPLLGMVKWMPICWPFFIALAAISFVCSDLPEWFSEWCTYGVDRFDKCYVG